MTPFLPLRIKPSTSIFRTKMAFSSSSSSQAFQLRLNPLTGDSEWVVIRPDSESTPSLLASTSYLDMLNDSRRNRAYRLAIEKTITKPSHVLDIGAGTGLLSMMSARTMEKFGEGSGGKVSACESYLPMGKLMRKVLKANGLDKKVKVLHKRSDELQVGIDLDSPADVLVSEILDSELLGEGLIPTLQHAHDNLLVKNPQTVPWRATTYGQLVESPFLWKLHDLYSNERNLSDGVHLTPAGLERIINIKPQQYAIQCNALSKEIRLLSEPFKIFEFDFWRRPESHRQAEMWIKATDSGTANAVISWWVLQLDSEGSIFYSTAPKWIRYPSNEMVPTVAADEFLSRLGDDDWCDHWKQCVWFIPGTGIPVSTDKPILFNAVHDETKVSYSLQTDSQTGHDNFSSTNSLLALTPERIAIYGDRSFRSSLIAAMSNALNIKSPKLCVIADDSVFLTILTASLSKTSNVLSSFPGLREKGATYLQAVAHSNGFSTDRIKVIGKKVSCLITSDHLIDTKIDMLIGEPFYYGNETMLPWHYLRFWKERTLLDSILSDDVIIMPHKGTLRVCAMSLPDLWRSRRCLKKIEGFDHSMVNETLGACGNLDETQEGPSLPYYIWQCGEIEELSSRYSVLDFDFSKPIHSCSGSIKIELSKTGTCHGFAVWIDWILDDANSVILSTGPDNRYWKQAVKLLNKPKFIPALGCVAEIEAHFNYESGEVDMDYLFS